MEEFVSWRGHPALMSHRFAYEHHLLVANCWRWHTARTGLCCMLNGDALHVVQEALHDLVSARPFFVSLRQPGLVHHPFWYPGHIVVHIHEAHMHTEDAPLPLPLA